MVPCVLPCGPPVYGVPWRWSLGRCRGRRNQQNGSRTFFVCMTWQAANLKRTPLFSFLFSLVSHRSSGNGYCLFCFCFSFPCREVERFRLHNRATNSSYLPQPCDTPRLDNCWLLALCHVPRHKKSPVGPQMARPRPTMRRMSPATSWESSRTASFRAVVLWTDRPTSETPARRWVFATAPTTGCDAGSAPTRPGRARLVSTSASRPRYV